MNQKINFSAKSILAVIMTIAMFISAMPMAVYATETQEPVLYRYPVYKTADEPSSGIESWTENVQCSEYTEVNASDEAVEWTTGWYVVKGEDININATVTVNGDVKLILCDSASLYVNNAYIFVPSTSSFTIYGQAGNSGYLEVKTHSSNDYDAAIGGINNSSNGPITINGGTVFAAHLHSQSKAAGIGGGYNSVGANITINGGIVTAYGGMGAGIGGGYYKSGKNITINGGKVTAHGCNSGAGIGGGQGDGCEAIYINDGEVYASSFKGAGIGGGFYGSANNIYIFGGNVRATSGNASGIGGGSSSSNIKIAGGTILAISKNARAIGNGNSTGLTVTNGEVFAGASYEALAKKTSATTDFSAIFNDSNSKYVKIGSHEHKWSYALKAGSSNTIVASCTAGCSSADCKLLTISYDSANQKAKLSNESLAGITELPEIVYYEKGEDGYGEALTAPGTEGKYRAEITIEGVTAYTDFEIGAETFLDASKNAEWTNKAETEADVTVNFNSAYVDNEMTNNQKVLVLGTLCSVHNMAGFTLMDTINLLANYADTTYYAYHAADLYATETVNKGGKATKIFTSSESSGHSSLKQFLEVLYDELITKGKEYDYILFEFDSARLAGDYNNNLYEAEVAEALKPYYENDKVMWVTDRLLYNYADNEPNKYFENMGTSLSSYNLNNTQFKALASVLSPADYENWTENQDTFTGISQTATYDDINKISDLIDRTLCKTEYSYDVSETLADGLTPTDIALEQSTDGKTWTAVEGVSPTVSGQNISFSFKDLNNDTKYRLKYTITADPEVFNTEGAGTASTGSTVVKYYAPNTELKKELNTDITCHVHDWDYELSEDGKTITASCSEDCSYMGTDYSITISAEDAVYDGSKHGASLGEATSIAGQENLPDIVYEKKNGTEWEPVEGTPTEAGIYRASVTVDDATAQVIYCILSDNNNFKLYDENGDLEGVYESLEEVFENIESGGIIVIVNDVENEITIEIPKDKLNDESFTFDIDTNGKIFNAKIKVKTGYIITFTEGEGSVLRYSATEKKFNYRCPLCKTYEQDKDSPIYGWVLEIVHLFYHLAYVLGKIT